MKKMTYLGCVFHSNVYFKCSIVYKVTSRVFPAANVYFHVDDTVTNLQMFCCITTRRQKDSVVGDHGIALVIVATLKVCHQ